MKWAKAPVPRKQAVPQIMALLEWITQQKHKQLQMSQQYSVYNKRGLCQKTPSSPNDMIEKYIAMVYVVCSLIA